MHSVTRGLEPVSLKQNKETWFKELKQQIEIKGKFSKVEDKYKNKYRQNDVKAALCDMYNRYCCYCEGDIALTGYAHIEHYKPKSKYPELCFEWNNLHQSCSKCNTNKNDKWDDDNPILNPTDDEPEKYLYFNGTILCYVQNDKRAKNTVDHLKLNQRSELMNLKTKLLDKVLKYRDETDEIKKVVKDMIMSQDNYISFRKYLLKIIDGTYK